jgi:hypothetical protein
MDVRRVSFKIKSMNLYSNLEKYLTKHPIKKGLDNICVEIYTTTELENIPKNSLGIYAWYFYPHSVSPHVISSYSSLFKSKKYQVDVSNKLNEKYSGEINSLKNLNHADVEEYEYFNEKLFQDFLQISAITMAPPIYIGRSIDLKGRLLCHKEKLTNTLGSLWTSQLLDNLDGTDIEFDSEPESECFANRVGNFFKNNFSEDLHFSISNFLVKTVYFKDVTDSATIKQIHSKYLRDIEYYFLRTYQPILSIR